MKVPKVQIAGLVISLIAFIIMEWDAHSTVVIVPLQNIIEPFFGLLFFSGAAIGIISFIRGMIDAFKNASPIRAFVTFAIFIATILLLGSILFLGISQGLNGIG